MSILTCVLIGIAAYVVVRLVLFGIYTVDQNERAVKTSFGRAERLREAGEGVSAPAGDTLDGLDEEERQRYTFPALRVIGPGGPYLKLPWQKVHKVSVATETVNMAWDPDDPQANHAGTILEAVTKDQLNTGLNGQIRYRVSERNLYAYLFGVRRPMAHVLGFFISVLRERIANFEAPRAAGAGDAGIPSDLGVVSDVSINDLRKNLRVLNDHMIKECRGSEARYGITLDASLITGIDPPPEVDSALAAINTAHNHVSSEISLAQAEADQKLEQSKRAVEIETLKAQAEVEPLLALADQLGVLKRGGPGALEAYLRYVRLGLYDKAQQVILGVRP